MALTHPPHHDADMTPHLEPGLVVDPTQVEADIPTVLDEVPTGGETQTVTAFDAVVERTLQPEDLQTEVAGEALTARRRNVAKNLPLGAAVAVSMIPMAQLLGEDPAAAKLLDSLTDGSSYASLRNFLGNVAVAGLMYVEALGVARLANKLPRLAQEFDEAEKVMDASDKSQNIAVRTAKGAVNVAKLPFVAIGSGFERAGAFLRGDPKKGQTEERRRGPVAKAAGNALYRVGVVNAMGTGPKAIVDRNRFPEGVPLNESKRDAKVFVASWFIGAEVVRHMYRGLEWIDDKTGVPAHMPFKLFGEGFTTITDPTRTPGQIAWLGLATVVGLKVAQAAKRERAEQELAAGEAQPA